jgi:hypothetical protein
MALFENFEYKGKSYKIYRETNETDQVFQERAKFIISQEPSTVEQVKDALKMSRVWTNMKFRQCRYELDVESRAYALANKMPKKI